MKRRCSDPAPIHEVAMFFPGMDPYLENPALFPGIHSRMVVYLADQLAERLQGRYLASTGERVYVEGPYERPIAPDVWLRRSGQAGRARTSPAQPTADEPVVVEAPEEEMREPYIEILDRQSGLRVVTVVELVSPSNKYAGPGRDAYVAKQREVLASDVQLVEIDLLRQGPHVVAVPEALVAGRFDYDYLAVVNRAPPPRTRFEVYPFTVRQPLPAVRIPLAGDDPDVRVDLRAALEQAYRSGSYPQRIRYHEPCQPPLGDDDQQWAAQLIRDSSQAHDPRST